jgi:hypothetical protein
MIVHAFSQFFISYRPILFLFFHQLALCCCQQECCCATTRADVARALPTQTSHTEERDDKSWARGDRVGGGHCRSLWRCGGRPCNDPWRRGWGGRLTRKAVTHRRTSLHAVVRRSQNQMAKYIVVNGAHHSGSRHIFRTTNLPSATPHPTPLNPFSWPLHAGIHCFGLEPSLCFQDKTTRHHVIDRAFLHLIRTGPTYVLPRPATVSYASPCSISSSSSIPRVFPAGIAFLARDYHMRCVTTFYETGMKT